VLLLTVSTWNIFEVQGRESYSIRKAHLRTVYAVMPPGYNTSKFATDFYELLDNAASQVPDPSSSYDFGLEQQSDYFFSLALAEANLTSLEAFTDTALLSRSAAAVFKGRGAQLAPSMARAESE
jgi:hypothetical protein